jgi:hypothetical protein
LVISSTNSGTPSVFCTICSTTSNGIALPPASRVASTSICGRSSRFRVSGLTCERAGQGDVNSGRKVNTIKSGAVGACSIS